MCQVSAGVAVGSQRWKKGGSGSSLATLMRGCDDLCFYQLTLFNWHCAHRVTVIYVTINYSKITAIRNETMLNVILPISLKLCTHSRNILRMLHSAFLHTAYKIHLRRERQHTCMKGQSREPPGPLGIYLQGQDLHLQHIFLSQRGLHSVHRKGEQRRWTPDGCKRIILFYTLQAPGGKTEQNWHLHISLSSSVTSSLHSLNPVPPGLQIKWLNPSTSPWSTSTPFAYLHLWGPAWLCGALSSQSQHQYKLSRALQSSSFSISSPALSNHPELFWSLLSSTCALPLKSAVSTSSSVLFRWS